MKHATLAQPAEALLTEREQFAIWFAEERAVFLARWPKARPAIADDAAAGVASLMMARAKRHGRVFAPEAR